MKDKETQLEYLENMEKYLRKIDMLLDETIIDCKIMICDDYLHGQD